MNVKQRYTRSQSLSEVATETTKIPERKLSINENIFRPIFKHNKNKEDQINDEKFVYSLDNERMYADVRRQRETNNNSANRDNLTQIKLAPNVVEKMPESKSDIGLLSVLTDNHGIGCEIVPDYLRADRIDKLSNYSNVKNMKVVMSSEAIIEYYDECKDFHQSSLKCIVTGLEPKSTKRSISPEPATVLRDEMIYLPYDNRYRRAALNVEIKPNIDALEIPVPIKFVKVNTFYDRQSRPYSRRTETCSRRMIVSNQKICNYLDQTPVTFSFLTGTRSRSQTRMYEPAASRVYRTKPIRFASMSSLSDINNKHTIGRYGSDFTSNYLHVPFRHCQLRDSTIWSTPYKEITNERRIPAPINNGWLTTMQHNKWHTTAEKVVTNERNDAPANKRWNSTTTEIVTENKHATPLDYEWTTTNTNIVTGKSNLEIMNSRPITTSREVITAKRNIVPTDKRWNTEIIETVTESINTIPMDKKIWNTTTTDKRHHVLESNRITTARAAEERNSQPRLNIKNAEEVTGKQNAYSDNIRNFTHAEGCSTKEDFALADNPSKEQTESGIEKRNTGMTNAHVNDKTVETVEDTVDSISNQSHSAGICEFYSSGPALNEMSQIQSECERRYHIFDTVAICNFDSKHGFNTHSHLSSKGKTCSMSDMKHETLFNFKCSPIDIGGDINTRLSMSRKKYGDIHPKTGTLHVFDIDSRNDKKSKNDFLNLPQSANKFSPIQKASSFPEMSDVNNFPTNSDRSRSTENIEMRERFGQRTTSADSITYVFVTKSRRPSSTILHKNKIGKLLRQKSDPNFGSSNDFDSSDDQYFVKRKDSLEKQAQTSNVYRHEVDENSISSDSDFDESKEIQKIKIKPNRLKHRLHKKHSRPQRVHSKNSIIIASPRKSAFAGNSSANILTKEQAQDLSQVQEVYVILDKSNGDKITNSLSSAEEELIKSAVSAYLNDIEEKSTIDNQTAQAKDQNYILNPRMNKKQADMLSNLSDTLMSRGKRSIEIILDNADGPASPNNATQTQQIYNGKPRSTYQLTRNLSEVKASPMKNKIITMKRKDEEPRSFTISHQWHKKPNVITIYLKDQVTTSQAATPKAAPSRLKKASEKQSIGIFAGNQNAFEKNEQQNSGWVLDHTFISNDFDIADNDTDNELDRLRRERQEVLELLSRDQKSSQMQVELAEAELNYIHGQTDTLLTNIETQKTKQRHKPVRAPDDIEVQLNVGNKNFRHRHNFAKDLSKNNASVNSDDKNSEDQFNYKDRFSNTEDQRNYGCSVKYISQASEDRKCKDTTILNTPKISSCALKTCNCSSPNLSLNRRTSFDLSFPAAFNNNKIGNIPRSHLVSSCLLNSHHSKQSVSICQKCPICLLKKQLSQSCSDLFGIMKFGSSLEQNIKSAPEEVLQLNNWKSDCTKSTFINNSRRLPKLTPSWNNGTTQESSSSTSSQYGMLNGPQAQVDEPRMKTLQVKMGVTAEVFVS